jgi:hypothetical protein
MVLFPIGSGAEAEGVPADFPAVMVDFRSDPAPGYVFLANFALDRSVDYVPFLMVLDNSGYPVRYRKLRAPISLDFKLQPDGTLTYCDAKQWFLLDANLDAIDSLRAGDGWNTDGLELRILFSGNRLVLAWRERSSSAGVATPAPSQRPRWDATAAPWSR